MTPTFACVAIRKRRDQTFPQATFLLGIQTIQDFSNWEHAGPLVVIRPFTVQTWIPGSFIKIIAKKMKVFSIRTFLATVVVSLAFTSAQERVFADGTPQTLPPPADIKINFSHDIQPILQDNCIRCHGPLKPRSHFRLDYREGALAGGDNNTNDIVPGNSAQSPLIQYVAWQVEDMEMPPVGRGKQLTVQQVSLLRAWIDQGAVWDVPQLTTNLQGFTSTILGGTTVNGDRNKYQELSWQKAGVFGGQQWDLFQQTTPDTRWDFNGHIFLPNDYLVNLNVDRDGLGFIHSGWQQFRKYYDDIGGYDPAVSPSVFQLGQGLYADNGLAWIDFGLNLPHWPEIVLGYEYQYRTGNESALDWGYANGKNIYPATQLLDEGTHTIKLDVTKNFDDWLLENDARVQFFTIKNEDQEAAILLGGATPDESINTKDNYRQVQGMDTLTLQKQLLDWWFLNGGFYYSRLQGSDYFNQTTVIPAFGINTALSSQQITLSRESGIFSFANLFAPLNYLTLSLGTQNEWTRESGFGESIPDLELGGVGSASSSIDEFKASQNANLRFTKIPFTVVSGDAQFSQDDYGIYQADVTDELQRHTVAENFQYDLKTGFSTSPWQWADLTVQYERSSSDTDYQQLQDMLFGIPPPTNGYPAFILERLITSDQFETKLVLRPASWLKTTLTYQITKTDYSSKTDPAIDSSFGDLVSEGGYIADGRYNLQTYGIAATLTPFPRFYFLGSFTYSWSRVITADNGDPSIVPYEGPVFNVNATTTYAMDLKTSLQLAYNFSYADYSQNNAAAGVPAGINFQRNDVIVGLTRKLTKNLSGALHYEFSQYREPSSGNVDNFTANSIIATLSYRWP